MSENILTDADNAVRGDKSHDYGPVGQQATVFAHIASAATGLEIEPKHYATIMIALKLTRERYKHKRDNLVDIAGWARVQELYYGEQKAQARRRSGMSEEFARPSFAEPSWPPTPPGVTITPCDAASEERQEGWQNYLREFAGLPRTPPETFAYGETSKEDDMPWLSEPVTREVVESLGGAYDRIERGDNGETVVHFYRTVDENGHLSVPVTLEKTEDKLTLFGRNWSGQELDLEASPFRKAMADADGTGVLDAAGDEMRGPANVIETD